MKYGGIPVPKGRKKRRGEPAATVLTRQEKLAVSGIVVGVVLVFTFAATFWAVSNQSQAIDGELARWRVKYHLSDAQVQRIRAIEEEFHGRNPLLRPGRTLEQTRQHHLSIAAEMNPDDGARFLAEPDESPRSPQLH